MANHPLNLALRFLLELAALAGFGVWGAHYGIAPAIAFVVVPAALWGTFRMRDDGGPPVIEVGGRLRLLLEAAVFGGSTYGLWVTGAQPYAIALAAITVVHYALGYDRVARMVR
ncbi:MAG TPA: YrdB family protein [Kofleriaceae bacterium]|nr:YrdB family protein [Kofleriaceae bacterium]